MRPPLPIDAILLIGGVFGLMILLALLGLFLTIRENQDRESGNYYRRKLAASEKLRNNVNLQSEEIRIEAELELEMLARKKALRQASLPPTVPSEPVRPEE